MAPYDTNHIAKLVALESLKRGRKQGPKQASASSPGFLITWGQISSVLHYVCQFPDANVRAERELLTMLVNLPVVNDPEKL